MSPDHYCQEKAARSGSSFYYSFLFLPPEQRQAITALYAFCREVDDVVDECSDVGVARIKLGWWREELQRCFAGNPRHPVTRALQQPIAHFNLPQEYFEEIIDGMEMDLLGNSYPSFKDLALYCHRAAGVVGLLSAEIFGYRQRETLKYAEELGTAFQLTNILRDVGEDARRGRIYIPLDELQQFQVDPNDLLRGTGTTNMTALFRFQAQRARQHYERAFAHLPAVDRYPQRSGIIMAAIYRTLLDEIETDGYHVLDRRVGLTPLRKLWIAWNTARRERRRQRKQLNSRPMPESTALDNVVIVGGGWAGLATAVELCHHGVPVTLVEAARQLGGRARSVRFGDLIVDNGQHIMTGAYQALLTLLERVGIATESAFTRLPLTLHCLSGRQVSLHLKAPHLPAPLNLAAAILTARGLSIQDKLQAIRFGRRLRQFDIPVSEDISVLALLHSENQTPALIAKLWEPLCIATLNTPIGDASARIFLRVLQESFTHECAHSDLLLPRMQLGKLLPNPGCDYLESHGAHVLLGQRVSALNIASGTVQGVTVSEQAIPAGHVVLATPHIISRRLMSLEPALEALCANLAGLGNEPVTTVYLQYPAPVQLPRGMVGLHDGIVQWVFDRAPSGAPGVIAVVISAAGAHMQMDTETLTARVAKELADSFPKWPRHANSLVIKEKRATFSSTTGVDARRPDNRTPVSGLWLAGDYTCNGLPATLEGAVRSGLGCARAIIDSIN